MRLQFSVREDGCIAGPPSQNGFGNLHVDSLLQLADVGEVGVDPELPNQGSGASTIDGYRSRRTKAACQATPWA